MICQGFTKVLSAPDAGPFSFQETDHGRAATNGQAMAIAAVLRFCQNVLNHDNDCETAVKNVPRWLPPGTSTRWIEWLPMAL